jgi:hypothetical protein
MRAIAIVLAIAVVGSIFAAASATAAEATVSDLRLAGGILPNTYKGGSSTTVTNSSGTVTSSGGSSPTPRSADSNYRLELSYMAGHLGDAGGFLIGVAGAVNQARFDNGSSTATQTTPVLDLMLGYGFAPIPPWHVEITPFAGFGWTYFDVSNNNQTDVKVDEHYLEYGIRAATYWTFASHWQLGLEVPYLVGRSKPEYTSTDTGTGDRVTVSDNRRNQGFGVLASVGLRF